MWCRPREQLWRWCMWCHQVRLVLLFQIGQTIPEARQIRMAHPHLTKMPRHPQPPEIAGPGISDRAQREAKVLVGLRRQLRRKGMTLCMDFRSRAGDSELGCRIIFPTVYRQWCLTIVCVPRYGCGIYGQGTSGSGRKDPSCRYWRFKGSGALPDISQILVRG